MKAITLWPEWAYAIQRLGKDGENRSWPLWAWLIGQPIAIHAGVRPILRVNEDREDELWCFRESLNIAKVPPDARGTWADIDAIRGSIVAVVRFDAPVLNHPSVWAAGGGQYFWPIREMRAIEPIKCRGAQGLWDVPAPIVESLRALGAV